MALALCWLESGTPSGPSADDVRDHLLTLPTERLVDLLAEHAREDERLAERLRTMTLRAVEGPVDVAAYRSLLDRALAVHGFVSWREAYDYFSGVEEAVDALDALLADGHATVVVELAEHALAGLEAAIERIDDSGGGTREVIERLERYRAVAEQRWAKIPEPGPGDQDPDR